MKQELRKYLQKRYIALLAEPNSVKAMQEINNLAANFKIKLKI